MLTFPGVSSFQSLSYFSPFSCCFQAGLFPFLLPVCFPWQHQMYLFSERICDLDSLPPARRLVPAPSLDTHARAVQPSSVAAARTLPMAPGRGAAWHGTGGLESGMPTAALPTKECCSEVSGLGGSSLPLQTLAAVPLAVLTEAQFSPTRVL